MVCLSGGKDSYGLLDILLTLQGRRAGALRGDRGQPRPEAAGLSRRRPAALPRRARRAVPHRGAGHLQRREARHSRGRNDCARCARACGAACSTASRSEVGATKIALGHHRDDLLATFFLNLFFGGKLKTMPPKLVSDDGRNVVIRPLRYVPRARPRALRRGDGVPDHPVQPVRLAGAPAAQAGHGRCCASGRRSTRGGWTRSSRRSAP